MQFCISWILEQITVKLHLSTCNMLPDKILQERKDGQPNWFDRPRAQTFTWISAAERDVARQREGEYQWAALLGNVQN